MTQKQAPVRRPRTSLTRDQVVEAAIHVLETDGYPSLSMRRVAQELGVGTMSLYWHVADRDELLDLVFDSVVGEQLLADVPSDWQEALRALAHGARRMFERYPWIIEAGPRRRLGTVILEHVEQSIAATESMGLPMTARLGATSAIDHYVLGYVMQHHAHPDEAPALTEAAQSAIDAGRYPHYSAFVADEQEASREWAEAQGFEVGLEFLLAGIAAAVASGTMPVAPSRRGPRRRRT